MYVAKDILYHAVTSHTRYMVKDNGAAKLQIAINIIPIWKVNCNRNWDHSLLEID